MAQLPGELEWKVSGYGMRHSPRSSQALSNIRERESAFPVTNRLPAGAGASLYQGLPVQGFLRQPYRLAPASFNILSLSLPKNIFFFGQCGKYYKEKYFTSITMSKLQNFMQNRLVTPR